jgi:hypothetical protein
VAADAALAVAADADVAVGAAVSGIRAAISPGPAGGSPAGKVQLQTPLSTDGPANHLAGPFFS